MYKKIIALVLLSVQVAPVAAMLSAATRVGTCFTMRGAPIARTMSSSRDSRRWGLADYLAVGRGLGVVIALVVVGIEKINRR